MRQGLLGPLCALALGGGASSGGTAAPSATPSRRGGGVPRQAAGSGHRHRKAHLAGAPTSPTVQARRRRRPNPACTNASRCTPAAAAAPTVWPRHAHPARTGDGAVTSVAPQGEQPSPPPGEMAISSPAFARNEPLPAACTCDAAGVSPPLEWRDVPAKAAALVPIAVDASSSSTSRGIRWIVADIDPRTKGVAAGRRVTAGGVVGENAEGEAANGPLCPPQGAGSLVELQLYALSEPLSFPAGFQAAAAESAHRRPHPRQGGGDRPRHLGAPMTRTACDTPPAPAAAGRPDPRPRGRRRSSSRSCPGPASSATSAGRNPTAAQRGPQTRRFR